MPSSPRRSRARARNVSGSRNGRAAGAGPVAVPLTGAAVRGSACGGATACAAACDGAAAWASAYAAVGALSACAAACPARVEAAAAEATPVVAVSVVAPPPGEEPVDAVTGLPMAWAVAGRSATSIESGSTRQLPYAPRRTVKVSAPPSSSVSRWSPPVPESGTGSMIFS